jgi:hypothetical protein
MVTYHHLRRRLDRAYPVEGFLGFLERHLHLYDHHVGLHPASLSHLDVGRLPDHSEAP